MTQMTKRQKDNYEKLLEKIAKVTNTDPDEIKELASIDSLYTSEHAYYEGQAVLNFFKARIQPRLEKGEKEVDFDKRYREWRIRKCEECSEEFAYAFTYDGVKFCSLECLDLALHRIGMEVTPGRPLHLRWGEYFAPAVVPPSAFATLKRLYGSDAPDSFVP
jgi:hypothetical protein